MVRVMVAMREAVGVLAALTALAACSGTAVREDEDAGRADVALVCAPASDEPYHSGVCDGQGQAACVRWAQASAGSNPDATALCVPGTEICLRADRCDYASCRCGDEPACGANQACVVAGATARCVCTQ